MIKMYDVFKLIQKKSRQAAKRGLKDITWRSVLWARADVRRYFCDHESKSFEDKIEKMCFYFDNASEVCELVSAGEKEKAIKEADKILNRYITLFNSKQINFGQKIEWTTDPSTRKQWPKKYWNSINIRRYELGDVRVVWELNRHRHFVALAKAYQYTHDEKYYNEFASQLAHWLQENPYEMGVNWTSGLEVAMRAISWLWCYFLFKDAPQSKKIQRTILRSLKEHAEYIYRYRSEYLHPNNHIIGEAAALYLISAAFPFLDRSLRWRNKAKKILEHEIERQVYADGCDKEQAFCYHRFVIDLLLQVLILSRQIEDNFSTNFVKKIEKMIEFVLYVMKSDRKLPMIGDSDNARGIPLIDSEDFWLEKDIFCIGSVLFNRGDFKYLAQEYTDGCAWLLGESGCQKFSSIRALKPKFLSEIFHESGYHIMRTSWDNGISLIFDAGPQGIGKVSGHGHADHLSFELAAFNKSIIIDPGTYTYSPVDKFRNYFRSTSAHNTVVIDNRSQSEPMSNFDWRKIVKSNLVRWHSDKNVDMVEAYHNGYRPITHRRKIVFLKDRNCIIIKDIIEGSKTHKIDSYMHLAPEFKIVEASGSKIITKADDVFLLIHQCDKQMKLSVLKDFVSYNYGQLTESNTINYTKTEKLPCEFITILLLSEGECPTLSDVQIEELIEIVNSV